MILLATITFIFIIQLGTVFVLVLRGQKFKKVATSSPKSLSVIIPFKNEAARMEKLLAAINQAKITTENIEFIFVNDHSTDHSVVFLQDSLKCPYTLLSLSDVEGKKMALHTGISAAKYPTILTLDADVSFDKNYLNKIQQLPDADLIILPVAMQASRLLSRLYSIEFRWLQRLTFGSGSPLLCNGANLLFKKKTYQEVFFERTDLQIESGDDVFLLQAFQKKQKKILRVNRLDYVVFTNPPDNLVQLFEQRLRWLSKLSPMLDLFSFFMILFLVIVQITWIIAVIMSFFNPLFLIPIGLKFLAESLAMHSNYLWFSLKDVIAIILHQFWYPVYLVLLFFRRNRKPNWRSNPI